MDGDCCFHNQRNAVQALAWPPMALRDAAGEARGLLSVCFYHLRQFVLLNPVPTLQLWAVSRTPPARAWHDVRSGGAGKGEEAGTFPGSERRCCSSRGPPSSSSPPGTAALQITAVSEETLQKRQRDLVQNYWFFLTFNNYPQILSS